MEEVSAFARAGVDWRLLYYRMIFKRLQFCCFWERFQQKRSAYLLIARQNLKSQLPNALLFQEIQHKAKID